MARKPRSKQDQELEDALDRLFATPVPVKDSGPDPLDILDSDEPAPAARPGRRGTGATAGKARAAGKASAAAAGATCEVVLDAADRLRANMLLDRLYELTGEHHDLATALRLALHACPLDLPQIGPVFEALPKSGAGAKSAEAAAAAKRPVRKNKPK